MSKTLSLVLGCFNVEPTHFLPIQAWFSMGQILQCAWQHLSKVNLSSQHHLEAIVPSQHFFPAAVPSTPSKHSVRGTNSAPTKGPKSRYRRKGPRDMKLEIPKKKPPIFSPEKFWVGHLEVFIPGFQNHRFFYQSVRSPKSNINQRLWDLFMLLYKPVSWSRWGPRCVLESIHRFSEYVRLWWGPHDATGMQCFLSLEWKKAGGGNAQLPWQPNPWCKRDSWLR